MIIKVLGGGCPNCVRLEANTKEALKQLNMEAEIIKVKDMKDIVAYGVMSTPALVVDEKVVSYGKVLKPAEIAKLIK
ncbi:thioredoxin family protein [Candidatus Izimaplasma bacterium ZiA1]|uniref:thioredoxin family protein n=1 Tax=Candidatus Izimoplasma sp. ZiA1 TaxID=2024899 RepID=UPI000BAA7034|nr:thioredoxin family protein [Candidatus Izimaplasma bacterium ZiA1]